MSGKSVKVVFAADCPPCGMCGEPFCLECKDHYADCECVDPTMDGYEFWEDEDGVMWARPVEE